jgi:hypothetical protein
MHEETEQHDGSEFVYTQAELDEIAARLAILFEQFDGSGEVRS